MMQYFNGADTLRIHIANCAGLDKLNFSDRLLWCHHHDHELEILQPNIKPKEMPLYKSAVHAYRQAQQGQAIGHMVEFDATASGAQIMAAITGCVNTATVTNLIDPTQRYDLYTELDHDMQRTLNHQTQFTRAQIKDACVPYFYGSSAMPEEIYGKDTLALRSFYQSTCRVLPGAVYLRDILINAWQSSAVEHQFTLPDQFHVKLPSYAKHKVRVEIDELNTSFTHQFRKYGPVKKGLHLAANVIHAIDAYLCREIIRRCKYSEDLLLRALDWIAFQIRKRELKNAPITDTQTLISTHVLQWSQNQFFQLTDQYLLRLQNILETMYEYKPFDLVTIHDAFRSHPNDMNHIRYWYKELLAELAESNLICAILSQIYQQPVQLKLNPCLAPQIRQSNYALS